MDDFGRILEIGVHDDDRAAGSAIESGGDRDLMAEIARELDEPIATVGPRLALDHDRARVARSVVDDNHLAGRVERVQESVEALEQNRHDRLLVEDRHDEGISRRHGGAVLVHEG